MSCSRFGSSRGGPLGLALASLMTAAVNLGCAAGNSGVGEAAKDPASAERRAPADDEGRADDCYTGGAPDVVQARVVIRERPTNQITSIVDIETAGPQRDAVRACYAALMREVEIETVSRGVLVAQVARECSLDAMPSAVLAAPAWLIDSRTADASTWLGITSLAADPPMACNRTAFDRVDIATLRRSGYPDLQSCDRARKQLEGAMRMAESRARIAAVEWLDQQLIEQRQRIDQACAKEADKPSCQALRQLLEQLQQRRDEVDKPPPGPPDGIAISCRAGA